MISLKPREQFMILRKLGDHTDATTYYVQAVIRNSISGAILDTINLTDSGSSSRRFYKLYEVPSDISGEGFYIDIESSVYTDSGYTTKASTYADELEQYLIFDRTKSTGGGGGSVDVDYKKIDKMLAKAISSLEMPEMSDLGPIQDALKAVHSEIKAIKIPNPEKLDNTPVILAIKDAEKSIVKSIVNKEVTPITELSGLEAKIMEKIDSKEPNFEKILKAFAGLKEIITNFIDEDSQREDARGKFEEIKKFLGPIFEKDPLNFPKKEKKEDERIKKLTGGL